MKIIVYAIINKSIKLFLENLTDTDHAENETSGMMTELIQFLEHYWNESIQFLERYWKIITAYLAGLTTIPLGLLIRNLRQKSCCARSDEKIEVQASELLETLV